MEFLLQADCLMIFLSPQWCQGGSQIFTYKALQINLLTIKIPLFP